MCTFCTDAVPNADGRMRIVSGVDLGLQAWLTREDDPLDRARFLAIQDRPFGALGNKPEGGLWTSTLVQPETGASSAWVAAATEMNLHGDRDVLWVATPDPGARIAVVDSIVDLVAVQAIYPRSMHREFARPGIDFYQAAQDGLDAIHLTEAGQYATRYTHPLDLYGWDCECTLWLRWAFTSTAQHLGPVIRPPRPRDRDDDGTWHPDRDPDSDAHPYQHTAG